MTDQKSLEQAAEDAWSKRHGLTQQQIECAHDWEGIGSDGNFYNHCGICQNCGVNESLTLESTEYENYLSGFCAAWQSQQSAPKHEHRVPPLEEWETFCEHGKRQFLCLPEELSEPRMLGYQRGFDAACDLIATPLLKRCEEAEAQLAVAKKLSADLIRDKDTVAEIVATERKLDWDAMKTAREALEKLISLPYGYSDAVYVKTKEAAARLRERLDET